MTDKKDTSSVLVKQISNRDYNTLQEAGFTLAALVRSSIDEKAKEISNSNDVFGSQVSVRDVNSRNLEIIKKAGFSTSCIVRQYFKNKADKIRKQKK